MSNAHYEARPQVNVTPSTLRMSEALYKLLVSTMLELSGLRSWQLGFLLHIVIEIPACLNFFFLPSRQLGLYTPHAHSVIRQYAALLFASVLVATVFVQHPVDNTSGKVAGALALYHVAPCLRSVQRLSRQSQLGAPTLLSEAFLYLVVHVVCGAALIHDAWSTLYIKPSK